MFRDSGHRPHARYDGEKPRTVVSPGPTALTVTLDTWGPKENLLSTIYNQLQSNWGNEPSRVMRDEDLSPRQLAYVRSAFEGKTLPQVLELISFAFTVDGCSRASTHQLVRTRIGAGYMQHGGRDNDWRHRGWTMPETIVRALAWSEEGITRTEKTTGEELKHCVTSLAPLAALRVDYGMPVDQLLERYLNMGKDIYSALVDAGVPWQDARRVLWMGTQTYIHINYNYAALQGVMARRLEHVMDWEINCIAQLMLREVKMKCHPFIGEYLGSMSDRAQRAMFAGLESWPPDKKWPVPADVADLPRTHRPEQNPFLILHPDSMAGGPIQWIRTNGTYPEALRPKP